MLRLVTPEHADTEADVGDAAEPRGLTGFAMSLLALVATHEAHGTPRKDIARVLDECAVMIREEL